MNSMAQCSYCGAILEPGTQYCLNCGGPIPADVAQSIAQQSTQQPYGQQPYGQQPFDQQPYVVVQQVQYGPSQQMEMPMKWFKFIIYFQLFAFCVLNALNGINVVTGSYWGVNPELLYKYYSGLQTVDIIYGLGLLVMAVFAIIIRGQLAQYKTNGPKMYIGLMAASIILAVVYLIMLSAVVGNNIDLSDEAFSSVYSSIATSVVLLGCNVTYFKKRQHLFVN